MVGRMSTPMFTACWSLVYVCLCCPCPQPLGTRYLGSNLSLAPSVVSQSDVQFSTPAVKPGSFAELIQVLRSVGALQHISELGRLSVACVSQLWALCEDSAVWAERTLFERCQKVARRVRPEECQKARQDHPLLDFTSTRSQEVAPSALISEEGLQPVLQRADVRTFPVATQRNRDAPWRTQCAFSLV